ncbi:MAG: hypothetical protein H6739_04275 [Alphaproteobacteria bacterium]|nr:hypothetical protein [Alphaproteobacteria bacterium]
MHALLTVIHWVSVTVWAGSLVAFTVLMTLRHRLAPLASEHVVRAWRAWGAGLGLSMGTLFFSGVGLHWLRFDGMHWTATGPQDTWLFIAEAVFLVLWVSSFQLEVWTLEPCRKLDADGVITDRAAYESCADRVTRQLWFNVALMLVVGTLSALATG